MFSLPSECLSGRTVPVETFAEGQRGVDLVFSIGCCFFTCFPLDFLDKPASSNSASEATLLSDSTVVRGSAPPNHLELH